MPTRTLYELTPSQQLSMLNRHWTLHKSIVNIATSVTIHERLDTAVLCQAVRVCVLRWDSFGLRFVKEHGEYRQYFGPRDCLYVEQHDFASAAEQERLFAEAAPSLAALGLQTELDLTQAANPVLRVRNRQDEEVRLPIHKNELLTADRTHELEGLVVMAEQTGKVYVPRQAITLIRAKLVR